MARSFLETSSSEPTGPVDCTRLTASVTLDSSLTIGGEGDPLHLMRTDLISFTTDPDTTHRMQALASTIRRGRQTVTTSGRSSWLGEANRAVRPGVAQQVAFVMAVPGHRRDFWRVPACFDLPQVTPIILVTDMPEVFTDIPHFRHGVVTSHPDDVLGTALTVFRILTGLMAPETYSCTDAEDVQAVFRRGRPARICHATWAPQGGLLFASPEDRGLLECAGGVLYQLELEKVQTLRATTAVMKDIRRFTPHGADVIPIAPVRMFASPQTSGGFVELPLICV